ncbi:MAG: GNAT family N-acetyltransferase [Lachnospiraceae bacterium]|nr:GNAT family N-acetyltransferase [Lachnospiraceae bacterium]
MIDYTIRNIEAKDDPVIAQIIRYNLKDHNLDIPGTVYFDEGLDHLSEFYNTDDRRYYVAEISGKIIGGIGFAPFKTMEKTAELQKIYLIDEVKGQGIGYELIDYVEEQMREAGFKRSYLETHDNLQAAIHIYKKSGYREIERPKEVVHSTMNRFFIKHLKADLRQKHHNS